MISQERWDLLEEAEEARLDMSGTEDNPDPALIFPGPVAVVAGPGSGKTTVLAKRIKHLVEIREADPQGITVITFTREAARNMKERLTPPAKRNMPDVTLPKELHPPVICTMHSLGWRIIRENADRLGIAPKCTLLPKHMRLALFVDAAFLCGEDGSFGRICADQKSLVGKPMDDRQQIVFDTYQKILRACNCIDYDDQIIMACQLLSEHEDVRVVWQKQAEHLLVDEYQDINSAQLELIQLLSGPDASGLFVVGDDDQSIYRFRGAKPSYIRDFAGHFDGGQVIPIPDCFRCQPHIIKAAHGFIEAFNPDRTKKPVPRCIQPEGSRVLVHDMPSDSREAEIIATIAEAALREGDVLVLMPKPDYAEPLKAVLRRRRITFDAPLPRDGKATLIFAALRDWLADAGNNLAFRELLLAAVDGELLGIPGVKARKPEKIAERQEALAKVSELWKGVFLGASLRESLGASAQDDELYKKLGAVANELAQAIEGTPTEFGQRTFEALKPWVSSSQMLDELATSSADLHGSVEGDANLVRIMTMRNSKGLEAETVFILGLEEGAFPDSRHDSEQFEEDARLFYVSMTRAKKDLHLCHARTRPGAMTFRPKSYSMKPSPFIRGLPKQHIDSRYHPSAAKRSAKR